MEIDPGWQVVAGKRPSTVVVRFGETPDGRWWGRLPDGRSTERSCLGDVFDWVHSLLQERLGAEVVLELLQVQPRRDRSRHPAGHRNRSGNPQAAALDDVYASRGLASEESEPGERPARLAAT